MASLISKKYSEALFLVGNERNVLPQLCDEIKEVKEIFIKEKSIMVSLNHPKLPLNVNFNQADVLLKSNSFENYSPDTVIDTDSPIISNGNNVNLEVEMVELSKNASRYNVLSQLESKYFSRMLEQIKSAGTL